MREGEERRGEKRRGEERREGEERRGRERSNDMNLLSCTCSRRGSVWIMIDVHCSMGRG